MPQIRSNEAISAFDCEVLREAFRKSVIEDNIPEDQWRDRALLLVRELTGAEPTGPAMLDWIMRK
jgi:hypothetical protein